MITLLKSIINVLHFLYNDKSKTIILNIESAKH